MLSVLASGTMTRDPVGMNPERRTLLALGECERMAAVTYRGLRRAWHWAEAEGTDKPPAIRVNGASATRRRPGGIR